MCNSVATYAHSWQCNKRSLQNMPIHYANVVPRRQTRYTLTMNYSAIQTALLFKVARETIRKWAIEFEPYLSPSARPAAGGIRRFTESDLEVFALVSEMKDQGKVFDDIHAALRAGQRGDIPERTNALISSANNSPLAIRIEELEETIADITTRLNQSELARAKAEGREGLLQDMLREATAEIARLNRLLGPRG